MGLHGTTVVSYIILHNRSWSLSVWNCCICCFLPGQNIYNVTPPGNSRPFFFTCFRTCLQVTGQLNLACLVVAWETRIKTQKWREISTFWSCLKLIQKRFHRTELDSDGWTLHSGSLSSYNGKMATLGIVNDSMCVRETETFLSCMSCVLRCRLNKARGQARPHALKFFAISWVRSQWNFGISISIRSKKTSCDLIWSYICS